MSTEPQSKLQEFLVAIPSLFFAVLALVVVVGLIFATCSTPKKDYIGSISVFTDAAAAAEPPDECLEYTGRRVAIRDDESGEVLWRGETEYGRVIQNPALGCEINFFTEELPVVKRFEVTIEGLGSHVYRLAVLGEHHDAISWNAVCLEEQRPCDLVSREYYFDS